MNDQSGGMRISRGHKLIRRAARGVLLFTVVLSLFDLLMGEEWIAGEALGRIVVGNLFPSCVLTGGLLLFESLIERSALVRFVARRLAHTLPLILGITLLSFLLIHYAPGDYFSRLELDPTIPDQLLRDYRSEFGLDQSPLEQYLIWLKNILHLNFGRSFAYQAPVADVLWGRIGNTLALTITSLIGAWIIAVPLGVLAAYYRGSAWDRFFAVLAFIGMSLPSFFLAFLMLSFAVETGWFPIGGTGANPFYAPAAGERFLTYAYHLILPVFVLTVGGLAGLQRLLRSNMLEELGKQYVLTARAKGLSERTVVLKHALRNALNPMVTIFGYQLSGIFSGAALVEIVMNWPGLGQLLLEAALSQDVYVVMASLLFGSVLLVAGNLAADVMLVMVDPRIRVRA